MNLDFAAMIETWRRVLMQPGEEVFQQEKTAPNSTLTTALIWMVIAGVVAAIFGFIQGLFAASSFDALMSQSGMPPEMAAAMQPLMSTMFGGATLASIITVPVFFLIGTLIYHLLATVLGGNGDFGKFAYLMATFQAPVIIVSSVLGIIPFLGGCIAFLVSIYAYVLSYFAIRVNYGLAQGKALAVILIPVALLLLVGVCAMIFALGGLAMMSAN